MSSFLARREGQTFHHRTEKTVSIGRCLHDGHRFRHDSLGLKSLREAFRLLGFTGLGHASPEAPKSMKLGISPKSC